MLNFTECKISVRVTKIHVLPTGIQMASSRQLIKYTYCPGVFNAFFASHLSLLCLCIYLLIYLAEKAEGLCRIQFSLIILRIINQ